MRVEGGDNVGIGGFIVSGTGMKHVLLRAIGPSLAQAGVPNALNDPTLELHAADGSVILANDNWRDDPDQEAAIIASGIQPESHLESAIDVSLAPAGYTAIVRGKNNTVGVALVELYDLNETVGSKLANISTRAFVGAADGIIIGGFQLGNNSGNDHVIVRALGPSLADGGVPNTLNNPKLEIRDRNAMLLSSNDDWQDDPSQAAQLTAAGLAPSSSFESGISLNLSPGQYTALVSGTDGATGIGLVEVYDRGEP
jgi:hypothetical protein